jgi:hypothetical protein
MGAFTAMSAARAGALEHAAAAIPATRNFLMTVSFFGNDQACSLCQIIRAHNYKLVKSPWDEFGDV